MSNNVKFLNQHETIYIKNSIQKKLSLNSKMIPVNNSKAHKSFRGKIEKTKNSLHTLEVINENDMNKGNIKSIKKNKLVKMKSMIK